MKNRIETRFEVKGVQFPDQGPFLTVAAHHRPNGDCDIQLNFNSLNQAQKAKISLAVINNLAKLAGESLNQLRPAPDSPVQWVIDSMADMAELASRCFDILQPETAGPEAPEPPATRPI